MNRCVIVSGADIGNYKKIREYLQKDDFFIFCDCGLRHAEPLCVSPSLIVGDFDSYTEPVTDVPVIKLPCEKDDTDTFFAVKEAIRRGFSDILIIGAVGQRLDHTLGNISALVMLEQNGKKAEIIDDFSQMQIVSPTSGAALVKDDFSYFSVISLAERSEGITIKNAKYPLEDAVITNGFQYGISNEVTPGFVSEISVKSGKLLLIKVFKR